MEGLIGTEFDDNFVGRQGANDVRDGRGGNDALRALLQ
jgi:hypothetical protein